MRTTHSFGIDFLIRRCKDNKRKALIYARITVDEERREISVKEQIPMPLTGIPKRKS